MRPERTKAELAALIALEHAIAAFGERPKHAVEITDAPDALLQVEGKVVAVECRHLTLQELLKTRGLRLPPDKVHEIFLPREPQQWVKQAIEAKNPNVSRYKRAVGADEVWLLLHSSFRFRVLPAAKDPDSEILQLLRLGCFLAPHDFSQIWFAELTDAGMAAKRLFGADLARPTLSAEEYNSRFDPFPIDRHGSARPSVRQDGEGEKYAQINLNNTSATVCLQPLDDRYIIDYGPLLADPQRNANLKSIGWMWFDEDPEA